MTRGQWDTWHVAKTETRVWHVAWSDRSRGRLPWRPRPRPLTLWMACWPCAGTQGRSRATWTCPAWPTPTFSPGRVRPPECHLPHPPPRHHQHHPWTARAQVPRAQPQVILIIEKKLYFSCFARMRFLTLVSLVMWSIMRSFFLSTNALYHCNENGKHVTWSCGVNVVNNEQHVMLTMFLKNQISSLWIS